MRAQFSLIIQIQIQSGITGKKMDMILANAFISTGMYSRNSEPKTVDAKNKRPLPNPPASFITICIKTELFYIYAI